ncbi:MAG TPA: hypothetical protein VK005_02195 [Acholeplasma sp.]|nr:hypothetical protein [Acholeplasma sp.]
MLFSMLSSILAAAILSNVLTQGIGLELLAENQFRVKPVVKNATLIAIASLVIFVIDYFVYSFVLLPLGLEIFNLLILVVLMIVVNELYRILVAKLKFDLPKSDTLMLHSAILLVGLLGLNSQSFELAFITTLGSLLGFIGISILLTMNVSRMRVSPMLKSFKGLPILLILLGLIALVLSGLGGIF